MEFQHSFLAKEIGKLIPKFIVKAKDTEEPIQSGGLILPHFKMDCTTTMWY